MKKSINFFLKTLLLVLLLEVFCLPVYAAIVPLQTITMTVFGVTYTVEDVDFSDPEKVKAAIESLALSSGSSIEEISELFTARAYALVAENIDLVAITVVDITIVVDATDPAQIDKVISGFTAIDSVSVNTLMSIVNNAVQANDGSDSSDGSDDSDSSDDASEDQLGGQSETDASPQI